MSNDKIVADLASKYHMNGYQLMKHFGIVYHTGKYWYQNKSYDDYAEVLTVAELLFSDNNESNNSRNNNTCPHDDRELKLFKRFSEVIATLLAIFFIYSIWVIQTSQHPYFLIRETFIVPFESMFFSLTIAIINITFFAIFVLFSKIKVRFKRIIADIILSSCWVFYSVLLLGYAFL